MKRAASAVTRRALERRFGPNARLDAISEEFFGLTPKKAAEYAALNRLPVPTFRLRDSQGAPLMVSVADLAALVEERHAAALPEWEKCQI
jgi:hypothetical protein